MSRKPPAPPTFRLTLWARVSNLGAAARRARWKGSLAVLGIRTFERRMNGRVALFREGVEELSAGAERHRSASQDGSPARTTRKP